MLVNMQKSHSLQIEDNIKNITFPWLKNINLGERMCVSALSLKKKKGKKRQEFHFTLQRTDYSFLKKIILKLEKTGINDSMKKHTNRANDYI